MEDRRQTSNICLIGITEWVKWDMGGNGIWKNNEGKTLKLIKGTTTYKNKCISNKIKIKFPLRTMIMKIHNT